jgi:hypothetical protein
MKSDGYQCPNCSHPNRVGVLVCENCGRSVLDITITSTRLVERLDLGMVGEASVCRIGDAAIVLQIEGAKPITIPAEKPVTLGRDSSRNPRRPDVDLTAFHAFEKGVSRFHALLGCSDGQIMIADLGSANGTFIMGQRLIPHRPYALENRDQVRLANLGFVVEIVATHNDEKRVTSAYS